MKFTGLAKSTNNYISLKGQNISSTSASSLSAGYYIVATDSGIQTINLKGTVVSGTNKWVQETYF